MSLPAAIYKGSCTGHGKCIPATIHAAVPCGTPCIKVPPKPIAAMDATNIWPPFPQLPLAVKPCNVLINGIVPILDQDVLTNHPPTCTQLVTLVCQTPPPPMPCPTQTICVEDKAGGGAHIRKAFATQKRVLVNGKPLCRVADPLGPPCLSKIAGGAINVLVGS